MYVIPLLYRISSSTSHLSITRLHRALQAVIMKHSILRTALHLGTNGIIIQHAINDQLKPYSFSILNLDDTDDDHNIDTTINALLNRSDLFDLSKGRVICCHVIRQHRPNNDLLVKNDDMLTNDDLILINIHHSVFDGASTSIFLSDLCLAYDNDSWLLINDNELQYVDYSVHERSMDTASSRTFWHSQLEGYNLDHQLSLPLDRYRLPVDQRSGLASLAKISFDQKISTLFLNYASAHQVTPFQLGLATFYAFLFKLTHGQTNLCISCVNANRYRSELQNLIGMFVATLPYRLQADSSWSFDELVKHVQEKCLSILEHSHYPLQHILADYHFNQSNAPFLQTMFDFTTLSTNIDQLSFEGTILNEVALPQSFGVAKFDFSIAFVYDPTANDDIMSCSFVCSRDLFEEITVVQMARRFQHLCEQLFVTNSNVMEMNQSIMSLNSFSLIVSEEAEEIQQTVFCRLEHAVNEGM